MPARTRLTRFHAGFTISPMDTDLGLLEQKLATLIAQAGALRAANERLSLDLVTAQERHRVLAQRMQQASARLDVLLDRLPES
jgi:hypothetical protein